VIEHSERPPDELFREPGRPLSARIDDLLGRLTVAEKLALLHQYQAAVPRLGIGSFRTGTEALHGLAWLGPATVFPQALGLASTWNPDLVERVGAAVGAEVRGFHHKDPGRAGLNVWAPVVNPLRDPRWGRNEEGYAEDPWLTGVVATAYAAGLRGDHPRYLCTAPTLKHFLGYNNETDRDITSSVLGPRVLHEYELPAFRIPLAAGAAVAVMASYNLVNGRPAHLSPLIDDELRAAAPDLLVVGDAGGVSNIAGSQHYRPDHVAGFAAAVRAGVDSLTEHDSDSARTVSLLSDALDRGELAMSDVDTAVRRVLSVRFRLGEFDPPEQNPYAAVTAEVINCAAHQDLAREAARQSIVLLRNDGLLPLSVDEVRRVAVLGPLADTLLVDWYSGTLPYAVTPRAGLSELLGAGSVTFHESVDRIALRTAAGRVVASDRGEGEPLVVAAGAAGAVTWFDVFDWGDDAIVLRAVANNRHVGAEDDGTLVNDRTGPGGWIVRETFSLLETGGGQALLRNCASDRYVRVDGDGVLRGDADADGATPFTVELVTDGRAAAATAAREADVAVVVVGNHPMVNGRETQDRADLALPPDQAALVRAVREANPRTVLVISSSYPYSLDAVAADAPAILWSAHGGQEYGAALAEVLVGAVNPGGRLTQTWYRSVADLPDLLDYDVIAADATYQYFRGTPLFAFGHGLSYTTFAYSSLEVSARSMPADGEVTVSVEVTNTGERAGAEVVQVYTRQFRSRVKQPLRRLRAFRRVELAPGESRVVRLTLRAEELAIWDVTRGAWHVERSPHQVFVGGSATEPELSTSILVEGSVIPPRDPATLIRAVDHDDYAGVTLVDAAPSAGDAVAATEPGGWIAFHDVRFPDGTAGPASCRLALTRVGVGTADVTLRLDDPLGGPVVATVAVGCDGDPYTWTAVDVPVPGAEGRHDLYVVFEEPDTRLRDLVFAVDGR
jgi:beta-glucosidase